MCTFDAIVWRFLFYFAFISCLKFVDCGPDTPLEVMLMRHPNMSIATATKWLEYRLNDDEILPYDWNCPFMMTGFYCNSQTHILVDTYNLFEHLKELLVKLKKDRVDTIYFIGDSVTRQEFISISCSLHTLGMVNKSNVSWSTGVKGPIPAGPKSLYWSASLESTVGINIFFRGALRFDMVLNQIEKIGKNNTLIFTSFLHHYYNNHGMFSYFVI